MNKKVMALIFIVFMRDAMIRGIHEGFGSRRCDVYAAYA